MKAIMPYFAKFNKKGLKMANLVFHEDDELISDDIISLEERLTISDLLEDSEIKDLSPRQAKESGLVFDRYEEQDLTKIIH